MSPANVKDKKSPAVDEASTNFDETLRGFFASEEEIQAVQGISLEFYRDEHERRLLSEDVHEYLSFNVTSEIFGIPIEHIKEIIKPPLITQLPRTEPVVVGIISLRGVIVPVIDIGRRLGMDPVKYSRKTRILILEQDEELLGCLVDSVRSVIRLRDDQVEPAPQIFERAQAEHIIGVGRVEGEVVTLLNIKSLSEISRFIRMRRRISEK